MVDFCTEDRGHTVSLYRDPVFDKCLEDLRAKGGGALVVAGKVDEFIDIILRPDRTGDRDKFRFTWNGEARIANCKKVDLGGGYRLVCIKKDGHLALLYVGTHDDCFRWIDRNKGLKYDSSASIGTIQVVRKTRSIPEDSQEDVVKEQRVLEEAEAELMSRIDDNVLRKVFQGLCNRTTGKDAVDV
jgi:hypothetical protein